MSSRNSTQRPPRSLRKHIRALKADLRRELGREDAAKPIERALRGLRPKRASK